MQTPIKIRLSGHCSPHCDSNQTYREDIFEGGLQEVSKLFLSNELEEGWLQRISSIFMKEIHSIRSIYAERKILPGLAVVSGGSEEPVAGRNSGKPPFMRVVARCTRE